MAAYQSCIGYPWILDVLDKYDRGNIKQKSVPAQVVEFVKMPDRSPEDCQYPEAVVHISDQKYYITAIVTREAQETLEREDEHFTVADIKNKIIILKKFTVCFTAVEDLRSCEFYLNVQHFSVVAMETNTVDIMNCNREPGVRKKIKELWQNYMTELEMKETSTDMNLSDISLTQLLMVASEEKFSALKSIAEHCLDLNPFDTQEIPPQARTKWSIERRSKENTSSFSIPVHLLLIPPHEEASLEQMTEFRNDIRFTVDMEDSSDGENFSQAYSTALSTLSEDPMDDGPSQVGNPWNKLESLCVSVSTSSDSQPRVSPSVAQQNGMDECGADPDSSTPDILIDGPGSNSSEDQEEISPLIFSGQPSSPTLPETAMVTNTQLSNVSSSNSGLKSRLSDTSLASLRLIPLAQGSLTDCLSQIHSSTQRSLSISSKVQISPTLSCNSECENNSRIQRGLVSPNKEKCYSLRTSKAVKRKKASEDQETTLSDMEQQVPVCIDRLDSVSAMPAEERIIAVTDTDNGVHSALDKQFGERDRTVPVFFNMEKEQPGAEQLIKTTVTKSPKVYGKDATKKRVQPHKPMLEFVIKPTMLTTKGSENTVSTAERPTTSKANVNGSSPSATCGQSSSFQVTEKNAAPVIELKKTKLAHYDGTPFQYKYKLPPADLCTRVNSIRMPADLCEWAVKILSEHKEKVL